MKIKFKITILLVFIYANLFSQSVDLGKEIDIYNNDSFDGFEILDSQIANHKLILTGEDHRYVYKNISVEMKMFRYLVKNHGFKHLLIEQGYSLGKMINLYLQNGDSNLLEKIDLIADKSHVNFVKNLRIFNNSLADSQKITIHCIDVERFYTHPIVYMDYLLPKETEIPEEILLQIESIKSLCLRLKYYKLTDYDYDEYYLHYENNKNNYNIYNMYKSLKLIANSFDSLNVIYKSYLGPVYDEFKNIILSVKEYEKHDKMYDVPQGAIYREQYIFNKFKALVEQYPNDKFFGQFGRCHATDTILQGDCGWYHISSFINRVNQYQKFKTPCKAFAIVLSYQNLYLKYEELIYKPFYEKVSKNKSMLFPIYLDTANQKLKNRYKYLLISKTDINSIEIEGDTNVKTKTKEKITYYDISGPAFTYEQSSFNISNLKTNNGTSYFANNNFESVGMKYKNFETPGFAFNMFLNIFLRKQSLNIYDTSLNINGFNIGYSLGRNYFKYSSRILFETSIKVAFQNISLRTNTVSTSNTFPFGNETKETKFNNIGFLVAPHVSLKLRLSHTIWLGVYGGYNLDLGHKDWRYKFKRIKTTAPLNQSGFYKGISLFFVAEKY